MTAPPKKPKPSKYKNTWVTVHGHRFQSIAEARRYLELSLLIEKGEITDLTFQPRFPIVVNGLKICTYIADFQYVNKEGVTIVEDVKGRPNEVFPMKKKLFRAVYGFELTVVPANRVTKFILPKE